MDGFVEVFLSGRAVEVCPSGTVLFDGGTVCSNPLSAGLGDRGRLLDLDGFV